MKNPGKREADLEAAALHALEALPEDERRDLEAEAEGTPELREEIATFRAVAEDLALSAPPVAPRPEVRERLLAEVAKLAAESAPAPVPTAKPEPLPAFYFAHESTLPWTQIRPGVEVKDLTPGAPPGGNAILLRLAPGGVVKQHRHRFAEHCFVLSGKVSLVGEELKPGDYHLAAAGTTHLDFSSESGCVLLIVDGPPEPPTA